jgi:predicted transcriptional regulator
VVLASLLKREVISCSLEDTIETVLRLMVEHQVRHLPVMESYALVGVISATDLMRHYLKESETQPALQVVSGGIEAGLAALR